ncbi:hypothetical protein [Sinomonas terrae]|uniref:Uncharacterized protein n=1 Tax=Sinomonas terrae TaxID=2908838 RepID=A0ABS9U3S8_9MICC|nr:hypothetical protein [Sinomonas terrae]MCH6471346.1 hypothetical protein [Sinomonas terrae]
MASADHSDAPNFCCPLPFVAPPGTGCPSIYGLDLGDGAQSVVLRAGGKLNKKATFKRLSVALALLAIFQSEGLIESVSDESEELHWIPSERDYEEPKYSARVEAVIRQLEQANGPYQVQACFTFSRALALTPDPESAIIEFFKLMELWVKHVAWSGMLDPHATKNVLVDKILFSKRVKEDLKQRRILDPETVDLIYKMKEIRNKFVGHGGMRPPLGALFGDPEDYRQLFDESQLRYDPELQYGSGLFESLLSDAMLTGSFLFSKMQGIEPLVCVRPGRWASSSKHARDVLTKAGAVWIAPDPNDFRPA